MNAATVRLILLFLAPLELATVALIAGGWAVPRLLRGAVIAVLLATLALEVALWVVALHRSRRSGAPLRRAVGMATRHVVGDLLWEFAAAELASLVSLWQLITRRKRVPSDALPVTYHCESAPMQWLIAGLVGVELLVVHLVIPWPLARVVLLVLSIYSLIWLSGLFAGWAVNPHLLDRRLLIIRHGPRTRIDVPLAQIAQISPENGEVSGVRSTRYEPRDQVDGDDVLRVAHELPDLPSRSHRRWTAYRRRFSHPSSCSGR